MLFDAKLICPRCGSESPLKSFQITEEIVELNRVAAKFGSRWPWVEEYLHCFQSDHSKPLKPARMKLLLEELFRFVDQKGFNIEKHWHSIRPEALFEAIRQVAMLNKIGFKNHNYLKKVAIGINEKMLQKEDKDEKIRAQEALARDPDAPQKIKNFLKSLE